MFHSYQRRMLLACATAVLAFAGAARAEFPDRPIQIISPTAAGNVTDATGRLIAAKIEKSLGQPVVVENRPGADSLIGIMAGARAAPDGYTLTMATGINASKLFSKASTVDLLKDFEPVSLVYTFSGDFFSSTALPVETFDELVKHIGDNPGKFKMAVGSNFAKIYAFLLQRRVGAAAGFTAIPYKTTPNAAMAAASGETDMVFVPLQTAKPYVEDKKLRHLLVTGTVRNPGAPDVKTATEMGYPELTMDFQMYMFAPAGTPPAVVDRLSKEIDLALQDPEIQAKFKEFGVTPVGGTAQKARESLNASWKYWEDLTRDAKYEPQ